MDACKKLVVSCNFQPEYVIEGVLIRDGEFFVNIFKEEWLQNISTPVFSTPIFAIFNPRPFQCQTLNHDFNQWKKYSRARTTDTQWRHKSKISEKLGWCGRQNMLQPYLKIWEWEWIFDRAVKAISSLAIRSPCQQASKQSIQIWKSANKKAVLWSLDQLFVLLTWQKKRILNKTLF